MDKNFKWEDLQTFSTIGNEWESWLITVCEQDPCFQHSPLVAPPYNNEAGRKWHVFETAGADEDTTHRT